MEENKPINILLVDDDHFLLDMYLLKFKKAGLSVEVAPNCIIALEKLKAATYGIILVDIIMPGMDGLEFLRTLRNEKIAIQSTIIMLTNQADSVGEAKALGVDGYIIKATAIPSEVVDEVLKIYHNKSAH